MAFLIGGDGSPAANTLLSSSIPSTDNAVARFDGITGLLIEDSGVTISDTDAVAIPGGGSLTVAALSGVLKAAAGLISGGADSDDVPEGAVNFYYTEGRFDTSFSPFYPNAPSTGGAICRVFPATVVDGLARGEKICSFLY